MTSSAERQVNGEDPSVHLLFLGSPLLDITAHCDRETLDRYSLKSDDCVLESDGQEALFQSLLDDPRSQLSAGGSSQNTARIAKWVLGDRGRVSFAGCVGEDDFASTMRVRLESEGVEPLYAPLPGQSTGICACLLSTGADRSMIARLGAAEKFCRRHLALEEIRSRSDRADCLFVEGYFFGHSPDVMLALADTCPESQVFSLSLSAEYICRDHCDTFLRVLHRVDVLFSNEAEARAIAPPLGLGENATVEETARVLATRDRPASSSKPRIVLVTRGPNPVLLVRGGEAPLSFPVPDGVTVKDSVGCGDALAGAFLAVYALTGDVSLAAQTGIAAATEIAQVSGCNPTSKKLYPHADRCDPHAEPYPL